MEGDLVQETRDGEVVSSPAQLHVYLSVAKLLHTASSLPHTFLPHFQYLQWGFSDVGSPHSMSTSCLGTGPVYRICTLFSTVEGMERDYSKGGVNLPGLHRITSVRELAPFFISLTPHNPWGLHQSHTPVTGESPIKAHHVSSVHQQTVQISVAEKDLLRDFLEPFSS
jgi:hypothetical protein